MTVGTLALIMENRPNLYRLWLLSGLSGGIVSKPDKVG